MVGQADAGALCLGSQPVELVRHPLVVVKPAAVLLREPGYDNVPVADDVGGVERASPVPAKDVDRDVRRRRRE